MATNTNTSPNHLDNSHRLPEPWVARASRVLDELPETPSAILTATQQASASWVFSLSEFTVQVARRDSAWCAQAISQDQFAAPVAIDEMHQTLADDCAAAATMADLQQVLRVQRNRVMLSVVWRHLLGLAPLEETTGILSALADACIDAALQRVSVWEFERSGQPLDQHDQPMPLVVLALGKLGAGELNLSSDVDLIFFYAEPGITSKGKTHQQIFLRVGQRVIEALDRRTADGFVFRVDMRLRPYGDSGPLVMHFDAAETYYASAGRDWERYAFIKARACAGDLSAGADLLATLRGFVYRRYLDFGAIGALRDMKRRLLKERNDTQDIKLGPGGIRDAEFAVQMQQLIWGGREPGLQAAPLLQVLPELVRLNLFESEQAQQLQAGYRFLRDTEHCLQAFADEQTQALPSTDDGWLRLALAMGFAQVADYRGALDAHRTQVQANFAELVQLPGNDESDEDEEQWEHYLNTAALVELGLANPDAALQQLQALHKAAHRASVAQEGRDRLGRLMPVLLQQLNSMRDPDVSLANVLPLLTVVLRRSAYLLLLAENPHALNRLLDLCRRSRWLAQQLQRSPMFLDGLLDERQLQELPDAAQLQTELAQQLCPQGLALASVDAQEWLERLRDFKEQHGFQAALGQLSGKHPLMQTSNYLTYVAEAVLVQALAFAWRELEHRQQEPSDSLACAEVASYVPQGFVILGFGKLGGVELGPKSDLDVVFLHGLEVEHHQFLTRVVRRLLSFLGMPTANGPLFEIDTRLRPSGRSGTMITSIKALGEYYQGTAWTWEHQALVRARPVAGDPVLAEQFNQLRLQVLRQERPRHGLQRDVVTMRDRMLAQSQNERQPPTLGSGDGPSADVKLAQGGIVDIEFMVQYLVLAHAHKHPELAQFSDNVRILGAVQRADLLPQATVDGLRNAYLALRTESHRSALDLPDVNRSSAILGEHRKLVRECWEALLGDAS